MLYQIYLITNINNNKKYIGQTSKKKSYINRFKQHLSESRYNITSKSIFHKAIRKYGPESFNVELIEDNIPECDIDNREIYYIGYYDTYYLNGNGYNMTLGGQGVHGYRHTDATLSKISQSGKNYWNSLRIDDLNRYHALCRIRSVNLKGKLKSNNTRKKLSLAAKRRFENNPGTFKGKKHSEESKRKIAEANGCKVAMIDINTNKILKIFISAMDATKFLIKNNATSNKYANARILEICNGNGNTAYGYKWKRID
jgi:group I intron endonuclease